MFYVDGADQLGEWPTDMPDIVEEYTTVNHHQAADHFDLVSEILKENEGVDLDAEPPSPYSPSQTATKEPDNVSDKLDLVLTELTTLKDQNASLIASLMSTISEQATKIVSLEKQIASCGHCGGKKEHE